MGGDGVHPGPRRVGGPRSGGGGGGDPQVVWGRGGVGGVGARPPRMTLPIYSNSRSPTKLVVDSCDNILLILCRKALPYFKTIYLYQISAHQIAQMFQLIFDNVIVHTKIYTASAEADREVGWPLAARPGRGSFDSTSISLRIHFDVTLISRRFRLDVTP